ncbi:hypothetical protein MXB_2414 [Myxobolus squamalis]|nr:hypothetical protein MXB_2414 [Myxobolus squamalis]
MNMVSVMFDMPSNFTMDQKRTSDVIIWTCASERKTSNMCSFQAKNSTQQKFSKNTLIAANKKGNS